MATPRRLAEIEGWLGIARIILQACEQNTIVYGRVGRVVVYGYPGDDVDATWEKWKTMEFA